MSIRGIASVRSASDELQSEGGSNHIYIVDMGGLRIAHFGDIGQEQLTQEQLEALGEVDIALTQLVNPPHSSRFTLPPCPFAPPML